ncbi:DNA repair protein RadC [Sphingorhabdus sp. Alg239-R122]|uniref:RadC family protein n=1 Tax=Sphingorhabdus sp. Alg239-R122 TaxID=2305989 RepID=UPI0013DBDBC9|nr:DNA repair protein RadC [Sphingorhabdus sp. Alg239-R122]
MNSLPPKPKDKVHTGTGHRARLRERLLHGANDALLDHELIEYLLMLAIPRRDTKPLAKRLIDEFGGLAGVLSAPSDSLLAVKGMGKTSAAALKIAQLSALRLIQEPVKEQPILSGWAALLDYLRADMAHLTIERVRVLFLNSKNMLIRDEHIGDGSVDQAAIYTRQVIKRALDLGAVSLILVHNHPSGNPSPSKQDIAITREIAEAGRRLGISVHDHVIIGKEGHVSLRSKGLI